MKPDNVIDGIEKYGKCFSQQKFVEKISRIAKRAGAKLVYVALVLYYALLGNEVSTRDKMLIISALGYLVSPLDAVPDAFPILWLSDDMAVLLYVLQRVSSGVTDEVRSKAHAKLSEWFDADEVSDADEVR